jgi:hypothetical protein
MTSAIHPEGIARDQLLRSVAARVDLALGSGASSPVHDADAWREGEELMGYLATPSGADEEVLYVLGMLFLARVSTVSDPAAGAPADAPAAAAAASILAATAISGGSPPDRVLAWILLAPFYFHQPGTKDILESRVRDLLRELHGGPHRLSRSAREQGHAESLSNLGFFMLSYRVTTEDPAVARSAAAVLRLAAGRIAVGHPQRGVVLCNLGYALLTSGPGPGEIREAVGVLREAFRLTPAAHPDYARCANGLGLALLGEYYLTQNRDQVAEAAEMLRIATQSAATGHYGDLPQMLSDLGLTLTTWARSANVAQARESPVLRAAEEAVAALRRAVDLTPTGDTTHQDRVARLARAEEVRLGVAKLRDAASRIDDLLTAIERRLEEPEPAPGSLQHLVLQVSLRLMKGARIQLGTGPDTASQQVAVNAAEELIRDVQDSIPRIMEAIAEPGTSIEGFTGFSKTWVSAFDILVLTDEALLGYRSLLTELSPDSAESVQAKTSLGLLLFYRTGMPDEDSYTEAVDLTRELIATAWPPSPVLLSAWAQVESARLQFTLLAWQNQALSMPAEGKHGPSASPVTQLAISRASAALARQDAAAALETLEDGRAYLLSSALNTRRELEALRGEDAELYSQLVAIDEEFLSWQREFLAQRMGHTPGPEEMAWFRARSAEGTRIVEELRRRPGFDRFLMPHPLSLPDLQPAADGGPVISVNIDPRRCDALILARDGVHAVPLPRLNAADLAEQASAFRTAVELLGAGGSLADAAKPVFTGVLGWLWDVLAEPLLDDLGHTGAPAPGQPWPRIWWSPTGLLNSFPLHAAGHHEVPGAAVLDRVASSYTPTLRALLSSRARADRARVGRDRNDRRVLTVAMPHTPGHAPLAKTVGEATAAAGKTGLRLTGPEATRDAVQAAMASAAIVHFACHARSDPEEPSASRLILYDGDLTISDLTRLRLDGAELAYLSACGTTRSGTALAGEAIHLASAFQLAGYSQSVATSWEITDTFAAVAAARFHQILASALHDPRPLPAALALHATVRELRDIYRDEPWTWSALLHAGA